MSPPAVAYSAHIAHIRRLYRTALRSCFDWTLSHHSCRQEQINVRYMFEANRHVTNPKLLSQIVARAEKEIAAHIHPEPYRFPTSPFGSKYERNVPPPLEIVNKGFGNYVDPAIEYGDFKPNFDDTK